MADVFISYSRKNSDFVHKLDDALTNLKREVWVDWQDIARGEDWWRSIQTGIDSADTALIIVTEHWLLSEICQRELEYIRQQNKRVFPIILERIEGDLAIRVKGTWVDQVWEQMARDNWKYLCSLNWLFFDDETTFDTVLKDLITALDTDQLYVKSHTRYLVRALEWQQFKRNPSFLLEGDQLISAKEWLDSSANKHPEPNPIHHEYITASMVADTARKARDKAREQLVRRFRQMAVILGVLVVIAIITAAVVGQQFLTARAEVTIAGATLQQVNIQVTGAIQQQATAVAQANAAQNLVATATIEQGQAVVAQRTSFARENIASTHVAISNATLTSVPPTLTALALTNADAAIQQQILGQIANASFRLEEKDTASAIDIADQLINDYPEQPLAYTARGFIMESLKQFDEAVKAYTRAIEIDTDTDRLSNTYFNRANTYIEQDKVNEAIADYEKAAELDPQFSDAYISIGMAYSSQRQFNQAIDAFNKAIEIEPNADAYSSRGLAYQELGQQDKALDDFTTAIEIDPKSANAYLSRATLYANLGDLENASSDYWEYTQLNGTTVDELDPVTAGSTPFSKTFDIGSGTTYNIPFEAKSGQKLEASALGDQGLDTLLIVLDPDGNPVSANDNRADGDLNSAITDYVILQDGSYTLVLSYAADGEGKVNLTLDLKNPASPLTATPHS